MFESQPLNDSPSPSSLMASSSSSLSRTWKYGVFASLHGLDVPKTYVRHIRKQLNYNGITMFDDQGIERGQTTSPALTEAIRESRILIVVLSKNYASSSLCLDELLEILKCKENIGQIVMPVYYGVDKSHVRKQIGDFGVAFNETCARKTEEERRKWSQALNYVGKIAGEHFLNGDNAAIMIEKIAQRLRLVNPVHEREGRSHRTWTRRPRKSVRHLRKQLNYNGITMFDDQGIERGQTSLSISGTWRYHVFASFHGPDVRRTFFSHLRKQFNYYGIAMFDDQWIERSQLPALTQAIKESKISIVLLSKNYASSSWCLDELLEILKCKENIGQIVMTVFHGVEPSDVRKQTGDFGIAFNETCARKTEEERQRWSHALTYVGNIAGEHFQNWDNESEMIEKIARDISKKLDTTISRDFEDSARLETHLEEILSLLHLDNKDEAMIVFDPFSNKRIGKQKHRCSTAMAFLVVINLLLEIASAVSDQLFSIRKPYFAKISLVMSVLSVVFSILDLTYKIRSHKARFRCKWPIPWFYYPARGYRRIFGSFTDTVLLCCVVGGLIVSTINYSSIDKQADGPIKVSIWPLFFAIGMVGSKFMEKPVISKDSSL